MKKLRLNINGIEVQAFPGQTIVEVARENGIEIPTLCHDDRVEPYGSCGLCVVELEGSPKLVRACSTVVSDGMVIMTDTPRTRASRKTALELLLSDHQGDCRAPCSLSCPAGTDCQGYVGMVANGEYKEAVKLIKEKFPFPASIGRVCPHPCEKACRRGLVDAPISIANIKGFVGDYDLASGSPYMPEIAPDTRKSVAIVGGGPAGLTAAYHLRAKGHRVTLYDGMPKMGGMLRYGIPEYRLPKSVLDQEIGLIADMGITMHNNMKIGRDLSLDWVTRTHDAVLLTVGAWSSVGMNIPGEDSKNVIGGIDFLRGVAMNNAPHIGNSVAIVGGGNSAMDACRTAVRLGAEKVYCIYRRTRDAMPADPQEVLEAEEEGVIFKFLTSPIEIKTGADGAVSSVVLQKMELGEPDASGRRKPVAIEGAVEELPLSSIIMALGQKFDGSGLEDVLLTSKGNISADEHTFRTNLEKVFAAGDATNKGPTIAIEAIAEAEKASRVIDSFLKGEIAPYNEPYLSRREGLTSEDFADVAKAERVAMRQSEPQERRSNFLEVNAGYSIEEAQREASRCLECGCHDYFECKLIKYARDYDVEPQKYDGAEHHRKLENNHPFIDRNPDKCILCSLCVRVCDEVMGKTALGLVGRGFDSIISPALGLPLKSTGCVSCGQCVNLCPTGALGEKNVYGKRVPVDTKCTSTVCSFCSLGCETVVQTKGNLIAKSTPAEGSFLCAKGRFGTGEMNLPTRLTKPLIRKNGQLEPVQWSEAFVYIADKLQNIRERFGNEAIAIAISDKMTNEDIYVTKRYAEEVIGASHFFCFSNTKSGVKAVMGGIDCSTASIDEIESTDCIFLLGSDLMRHQAPLGIKVRKASRGGAKLITVGCAEGSDETIHADFDFSEDSTASLKGIIKALIDMGATADGIEDIRAGLEGIEPTEDMKKAAQLLSSSKKAIFVIDRFATSPSAAVAAADIALLTGHVFGPRNGILQVLPNVNSMGSARLGVPTYEVLPDETVSGIRALFLMGEDIPTESLKNMEFLAVCDLYLTDAARLADVVLPALPLIESNGHILSCSERILKVNPVIAPKSLENWEIVQGIANALRPHMDYANRNEITNEIDKLGLLRLPELHPSLYPVKDTAIREDERRYDFSITYTALHKKLVEAGVLKEDTENE